MNLSTTPFKTARSRGEVPMQADPSGKHGTRETSSSAQASCSDFQSQTPEGHLSRDPRLSEIITARPDRWNPCRTENMVWGLIRTVVAQQISTKAAITIIDRVARKYPQLPSGGGMSELNASALMLCGVSPRKAACCEEIARRARTIGTELDSGKSCEETLVGIKGVGPWTIAIFRSTGAQRTRRIA